MHRIVTRRARRAIQNVSSVFFLLGNSFSEKTPDPCTSTLASSSEPISPLLFVDGFSACEPDTPQL